MATVHQMRVVIPTTNLDCPAVNALSREGILFEAIVMEDDYHYSRLWCELWQGQEEFINIEHDVAPWPGALYKMMDCQLGHWCSHMYPAAPHNLTDALGCIRIGEIIMDRERDLYKNWEGVAWNLLDGKVMSNLLKVGFTSHLHLPPVAHVKR